MPLRGRPRRPTAIRTPRPVPSAGRSPTTTRPIRLGSRCPTGRARSSSPPSLALCEPGDEILYAWPSFSMYPHLPALSGAREVRGAARRWLRARPRRHARGGHRGDPAADRLQPQQPDRHPPAGGARSPPSSRASRRGPRSSSTRPTSSTRRLTTRTRRSTCWRSTPTWSCFGPSARPTGSPGCASATRSARPSSEGRWMRCASRSASTRSRRPRRPRRSATRTT